MSAELADREAIAARLPHGVDMCLLEAVDEATADTIRCRGRAPDASPHPLAADGRLAAVHALEYAAQAAALHGSLERAVDDAPPGGLIAAVRDLGWDAPQLRGGPLCVECERLAADSRHCSYLFTVTDAAGTTVRGRLLVAFREEGAP